MSRGSDAVKQKDKILYIEPNDLPAFLTARSANGDPLDNITWNPEDLNISVDLQVVVPSRQYDPSELKEYGDFNFNDAKYQSILSGVKLGGPEDNFLTDDWTVMSYQEIKNNRAGSKEMLGINSIQITFDSHMYPVVTMNFTDVRGSALMQPQEQRYLDLNGATRDGQSETTKNFFATVFKFPYPRFLLSVKGIYGTCVTFVLSVSDFKSSFNSETGNFDVVIKFIGNMYGLYTDIPMNYILIAPYIGSKTGGYLQNEYWVKQTSEGGAFRYNEDNHDGAPISTFLEFYSKYHRAVERQEIGQAYGRDLSDIAKKKREISFLMGSEGIIPQFYDTLPNMIEVAEDTSGFQMIDDPNLSVNAIFYNTDVKLVEFKDDYVDKFIAAVDAYKKEFPDGFFSEKDDYPIISSIYKGIRRGVEPYVVDMNAKKICNVINEKDSEVIKSIKKERIGEPKRVFVYSKEFRDRASGYVARLEKECNDKMEGATKEVNSFFRNIFDFSPTVENIMRMLFAHIDTFIHYFYATVSKIDGTRTLERLGGFNKALTDIESSSGANAHVPPFTAFFRETEEKKVERMYPGEDSRLAGIAEVGFVEAILNGIGSMQSWQEDYLKPDENNELDVEGDADADFEMTFKPTMLCDIFYDGANPYDSLRADLTPWDVLYFFLCRYYQYAVSSMRMKSKKNWTKVDGSYDLKKFADIEAENFINSRRFKKFANSEGFRRCVESDFRKYSSEVFSNKVNAGSTLSDIFSFNTWPLYKIQQPKFGTFTIEPKSDDFIPMRYNGVGEPDMQYNRATRNGFNIEKYSEEYLGRFSESLKSVGLYGAAEMSFDYENRKLAGGKLNVTSSGTSNIGTVSSTKNINDNADGDSEIIPLNFCELKSNNMGYYPLPEVHKNNKVKIITHPKNGIYYFKQHGIKKKGNSNEPVDFDYTSFDDFIKNGDLESMWIPSIRYKAPDGRKINLLIDQEENPLFEKDTMSAAIIFLYSIFFGTNPLKGDETLSSKISAYFNSNVDRSIKVMEAEYLLLCGVAYASLNSVDSTTVVTPLSGSIATIKDVFTAGERQKMADYFSNWADTFFESRILSAIEGSRKGAFKYADVTAETDMDSLGGVISDKSELNRILVDLYRSTVTPVHIGHLDEETKPVKIEDNIVRRFFEKVSESLNKEAAKTESNRTYEISQIDASMEFNENSKNAIYYTLKNLYDRWLSMQTQEDFTLHSVAEENEFRKEKLTNGGRISKDRSEFSNFVYVDSFYNDISKKFLINPEKLFKLIGDQFDGTVTFNILEFIGKICQDNKLLFRCLPVYSNVYSIDTFAEIFTPHSLYDGASRTGRRIGNTYMLMYTYEPSHFLDIEQDKSDGVNYGNDSFDIADSFGDITQESLEIMKKKNDDTGVNYSVCAFGVTAAKQNQSYFSKINVGMDSPRVTDYSIMNKFQLADMSKRGGTVNGVGVGQDLYSVYSNRSYDCSVEMLGCANIMPMMYFQLNNVPMFKGVYMITKVEHNISNNTMVTKFTGTRQPKRYIPIVDNVFSIEALNEAINRLASRNGDTIVTGGESTIVVRSDGTRETVAVGNSELDKPYNKSFPKGDTFYIWSAVKQIFQLFRRKGGEYARPAEKGYDSNCGRCATAVQTFLMAGFKGYIKADTYNEADSVESKRSENHFSNCDGYNMWKCLKNYGFDIVATKSTIGTFNLQAGDVCVTKKYKGSATPQGVGHVCMYSGAENGGFWASDFRQKGWWVYGEPNKKYLQENDVLVFRFMGKISTEEKSYA